MPEYSMTGPYNTLRASLPLCGDAFSRPEQSPKKLPQDSSGSVQGVRYERSAPGRTSRASQAG